LIEPSSSFLIGYDYRYSLSDENDDMIYYLSLTQCAMPNSNGMTSMPVDGQWWAAVAGRGFLWGEHEIVP
jgi:hypothetical protein